MSNVVGRGTTPTFTWRLRNILYTDISVLWLSIMQSGKIVIDKDLTNGLTLSDETETVEEETVHNTLVGILFTQEETLSLSSKSDAEAQIRVLFADGTAGKTNVYKLPVSRILKEGVIG